MIYSLTFRSYGTLISNSKQQGESFMRFNKAFLNIQLNKSKIIKVTQH